MSSSLSEYRTRLTNNILHAGSDAAVLSHIEQAISYLKQKSVNGHLIIRLVDRLSKELELISLLDSHARYKENIETAKKILTGICNQWESLPGKKL
jgi:hypothetical protein